MTKPFSEWTVLPHGPLIRVDENLMTVTGTVQMPLGEVERRMTLIRLRDGSLIIYSAIALDEPAMRELEAFGRPAFLVVPNDSHRLDARAWKKRYPELEVIAPEGARDRVEKVVHVHESEADFRDSSVHLITVPGTAEREMALVVETMQGTTLIINDLIFNLSNRPGVSGWLFKKLGMTGDGPHIPPIIKRREVKDERALRAQLESWARLPNLRRVVVSHGDIITAEPNAVLQRIAQQLAA